MPQHDDSYSHSTYDLGRMAFLKGYPCNSLGSHTARIGWLDEQDELRAWQSDVLHAGEGRAQRK